MPRGCLDPSWSLVRLSRWSAGVLALAAGLGIAWAQDGAPGLRGALSDAVPRAQQRQAAQVGRATNPAAAPPSVPASPGTDLDEAAGGGEPASGISLFADDGAERDEDLSADPATPAEPSASAARRQAAEEADRARRVAQTTRQSAADGEGATATIVGDRANAEKQADDADERLLTARLPRAGAVEGVAARPLVEADPFAPTGIRMGTFILRPSVEQGVSASSNASASPGGSSGTWSETALRLNAQSDWSRHQASINAFGTLRETLSGDEVDEIQGGIDATLLLDLGAEWQGRTALTYTIRPESASSPVPLAVNAEDRPLRQTLDAEAGVERAVGQLRLGVTTVIQRDWFGDVELTDGTTLSQEDRNSTLAALRLKTGYELSPALVPFVEVEAGRRIFDVTEDAAGTERSATRLAVRGGVALDLREKLSGELAAGYLRENFDDDDLEPIEGLTLEGNLRWSPLRGTNVVLRGTTSVEGTTVAGESGSLVHDLRLDVERTLRANLTGTASLGVSWRDYTGSDGRDLTLAAEGGLTWWLNRNFGVTGRARHERLESNLPGREYDASSIFLGVTMRR